MRQAASRLTGRAALENWMRAAAAGQAAERYRRGRRVPEAAELTTEFNSSAADVTENPDRPDHHDMRNFADLGLLRDLEVSEADAVQAGPAGWVPV
jgi:hypothetical protein